jgi:hypothetical protein
MGPGYFVIAILGCADGGSACTPVATLQTRYDNEAQCNAATVSALEANTQFDFPTLLARCQTGTGGAVEAQRDRNSRAPLRHG